MKVIQERTSQLNFKELVPETFAERKRVFLAGLKSPSGKIKYKRYAGAPIRYAGGKSLAVGLIVELLPDDITKLISPFIGGGSVEVACSAELGLSVVGYDIFDILINYWQEQIKNPVLLYEKLAEFKSDQETYGKVKERLKKHWKNQELMNSLDLAAHYYFNHNLSYGPGFLGWPSKIYLDQLKYQSMIEKVKNFPKISLDVECGDFEKAFEKYPNDFFYCDPPYLLGEDTKMFRGIYPMRNIPVHHNGFDHEKLRDLLKNHKGGFVLSYNNCARIRDWYKDFNQSFPEWQYTMGQGETRIGKNRKDKSGSHIKESHEILIWKI